MNMEVNNCKTKYIVMARGNKRQLGLGSRKLYH